MESQEMCSVECMRVRGTRHRSAIGCREEVQCRHMLLLQGGIWDLIVLCVLWVGAAACQKKDVMPAFYLKSFFFCFGSLCCYDPILDSMYGLHFGIWVPPEDNGFHLEASAT